MRKIKPVKPPQDLTGKIMKRIDGLDTPAKRQKEIDRLIKKYPAVGEVIENIGVAQTRRKLPRPWRIAASPGKRKRTK